MNVSFIKKKKTITFTKIIKIGLHIHFNQLKDLQRTYKDVNVHNLLIFHLDIEKWDDFRLTKFK